MINRTALHLSFIHVFFILCVLSILWIASGCAPDGTQLSDNRIDNTSITDTGSSVQDDESFARRLLGSIRQGKGGQPTPQRRVSPARPVPGTASDSNPSYSSSCIDSDAGDIPWQRGTVTLISSHDGSVTATRTDSCDGASVVEYFCREGGGIQRHVQQCDYGCLNGRCTAAGAAIPTPPAEGPGAPPPPSSEELPAQPGSPPPSSSSSAPSTGTVISAGTPPDPSRSRAVCLDSDGNDPWRLGVTRLIHPNGTLLEKQDLCIDRMLIEYVCGEGVISPIFVTCEYGCRNSACIKPVCTETDGGRQYYVRGTVRLVSPSGEEEYQDSCSSTSRLLEYYCSGGAVQHTTTNCNFGCSFGACQETEVVEG
ncbi:hypothetical protein HYU19_04895 [Candidatus Woesearchaeota archaeon]|nr:hypothetical protein [Candidatus Woesearchaeota archaeon]